MSRLHLLLTWSEPPPVPAVPASIVVRELVAEDVTILGSLFWQGFDDEDAYESPAAAGTEAADTLAGVWGPVTWHASTVALSDDVPVAATVIVSDTAHQGLPLLAFVVTVPPSRRQGIGRALILAGVHALHAEGVRELHLAVLPDNPAIGLYTSLGFTVVPAADGHAPGQSSDR